MPAHQCPFCGAQVDDHASHCPNCGGPQTAPPTVRMALPVVETEAGVRKRLDPWMITHPDAKRRFAQDPKAVAALVHTWRLDPDMAATIDMQTDIADAVSRGDVTYGERYYFCCPWAPVYTVDRRVAIGGRQLEPGQQFTFDVSAEGVPEGKPFKADILVSEFSPTDRIDYCLPDEGGHDDD